MFGSIKQKYDCISKYKCTLRITSIFTHIYYEMIVFDRNKWRLVVMSVNKHKVKLFSNVMYGLLIHNLK